MKLWYKFNTNSLDFLGDAIDAQGIRSLQSEVAVVLGTQKATYVQGHGTFLSTVRIKLRVSRRNFNQPTL